jgi:plastocyanin
MRFKQIIVASALVLGGCGGGSDTGTGPSPATPETPAPSTPTSDATVQAGGSSNVFTPEEVTVARGKAVTWSFGARIHNVTFSSMQGAPANVPNTSNGSVSRTFNTAGNFSYECTLHSGMTGTVKAQ